MKLQELLKEKKPTKSKFTLVITESQFKSLAKNVLNEQDKNTIKNTFLIKTK